MRKSFTSNNCPLQVLLTTTCIHMVYVPHTIILKLWVGTGLELVGSLLSVLQLQIRADRLHDAF